MHQVRRLAAGPQQDQCSDAAQHRRRPHGRMLGYRLINVFSFNTGKY
jgi:hypothetical protein